MLHNLMTNNLNAYLSEKDLQETTQTLKMSSKMKPNESLPKLFVEKKTGKENLLSRTGRVDHTVCSYFINKGIGVLLLSPLQSRIIPKPTPCNSSSGWFPSRFEHFAKASYWNLGTQVCTVLFQLRLWWTTVFFLLSHTQGNGYPFREGGSKSLCESMVWNQYKDSQLY